MPSPDGTWVAYRSSTGEPQIAITDVGGQSERVLLKAPVNENFGKLQWSPDGKQVAFIVHKIGDPLTRIDAIDIEGGARNTLLEHRDVATFAWLTDGRIVFATRSAGGDSNSALLWESDGGHTRNLEIGGDLAISDVSATADAKRMVIIRSNAQSDVFVAQLHGETLDDPRRLTLDDRNDYPTSWQGDNKAVLFESDRNGTLDVFRQTVGDSSAEELAGGPGEQYGAQSSPDGTAVLYWSSTKGATTKQLMMIAVSGGPAQQLADFPVDTKFKCARDGCILARSSQMGWTFESLNWQTGEARGQSFGAAVRSQELLWNLSQDAKRIAYSGPDGVHVLDATGKQLWSAAPELLPGNVSGLAFGNGTDQLLITTSSARENDLLLVTSKSARKIWSSARQLCCVSLSADGNNVLVGITTTSSNAWLLEEH